MKDYLAVLRHLLQIKGKEVSSPHIFKKNLFSKVGKTPPNPILSAKTVEKIFEPALPLSAIPSLDFFVAALGVPAGNQWGTALSLRTEDLPERRKKGSAYCTFIIFFWLYNFSLQFCLCLIIRVWLGWNIWTYRSRDGYCCLFCNAGSTLSGCRAFPGV